MPSLSPILPIRLIGYLKPLILLAETAIKSKLDAQFVFLMARKLDMYPVFYLTSINPRHSLRDKAALEAAKPSRDEPVAG